MADPAQAAWYRGEVIAWAMYDWANSAYSTLSITIVVVYFSKILFPETDWGTLSGAMFAYALGGATLLAGVCSPVIGALADARHSKGVWLRTTALLGAALSLGLAACPATSPWLALAIFVGIVFCFEISYGMANAFLPQLASDEQAYRRGELRSIWS